MPIHQAVIHQQIRNWAPFLVTECRFQDTRGCSEIVCRQVSGGEKVEATLLFLVNIKRKGHAYIQEPPTQELGVFLADNPQGVSQTTPKRSQVLKSRKKLTKVTFLKMGKIKNLTPFWH